VYRTSKGDKASYALIPTIQDELSDWLLEKIQSNERLACIIDDYNTSPTDQHHMELFYAYGLSYENEVYYLLQKEKISRGAIIECLQNSNTFWHSLCVLSETNFNDVNDNKLTLEKIKEICLNARLIIVGAYDGEGYVFWEKNNSSKQSI